ncbi:MAG: hypothetical protein A2157_17280 [Deltaproteobacteria bacterium RBG_16_47_11]|nr:MAG: hypothetical protein A2157_17280 [Deltaproteobacteria bacterium RBG_16_47_11]
MMKKKIGLLGGIGPETTGEFYLTLISKYQGKGLIQTNEDFPQIVINSIPAPELLMESLAEVVLDSYLRGMRELEEWGVDFIAMICNTVHVFYDFLQKQIDTPIIDLRREMRTVLSRRNVQSMIILGTPMTIYKGLYRFEGILCRDLGEMEMKALTTAIFNFNKGYEKRRQIHIVQEISKTYFKKCDLVVAGCSEIGLMLKNGDVPFLNPMDVLAESVVEHSLQPASRRTSFPRRRELPGSTMLMGRA